MKVDKVFFDFGDAIKYLKNGIKVARKGWKDKDVYVIYQKGYPDGIPCNENTAAALHIEEGSIIKVNPYFQIRCEDGSFSIWSPSCEDILAEDWYGVILD